jgi:segregation and condensation protein B
MSFQGPGEDSFPSMDWDDPEEGLSLEQLSEAYAKLLASSESSAGIPVSPAPPSTVVPELFPDPGETEQIEESLQACPVTPWSILEAVLFVGHPENQPITPERIAGLMRGVRPAEIDQWVLELNQMYRQRGYAMEIASASGGYRMQFHPSLHRIKRLLAGEAKPFKLPQVAIDCLALVSYQPGLTRLQLQEQYPQATANTLAMLVRRSLLELRMDPEGPVGSGSYFPTQRLLELFGLSSLDELPQVEEE